MVAVVAPVHVRCENSCNGIASQEDLSQIHIPIHSRQPIRVILHILIRRTVGRIHRTRIIRRPKEKCIGIIIRIRIIRKIAPRIIRLLRHQPKQLTRRKPINIHNREVREEPSRRRNLSHLPIRMAEQLPGNQMVVDFPGLAGHNIELGFFVGEGDGRVDVGADADAQHEDVGEGQGDLDDDQGEEWPDLGDVGGEEVDDGFFEVVEDLAALLDAVDDRGEVVIE